MKLVKIILLLCWGCVTWLGCGKMYQSIATDNLGIQLNGYEGQRISILGVPAASHHSDFLPPMPYNEGRWRLVVNGVSCTETVNFENQPRLRSMLQMAAAARRENQPIKVSGVVKEGQLDMEYFEEFAPIPHGIKIKIRTTLTLPIMNGIRLPIVQTLGFQNFKDAVARSADNSELYDAKDKLHIQLRRYISFLNTKAPSS